MWCPKALFLPHKYLDIILCYTVCQAILSTALFLFLPIYIMSERQWEAEVYWFYSAQEASRQQILSLREKGHLTHKPLCWSEDNASMKWLKIEKKLIFEKKIQRKPFCITFISTREEGAGRAERDTRGHYQGFQTMWHKSIKSKQKWVIFTFFISNWKYINFFLKLILIIIENNNSSKYLLLGC